jgi:hypothetical protein
MFVCGNPYLSWLETFTLEMEDPEIWLPRFNFDVRLNLRLHSQSRSRSNEHAQH